MSDQPFDQPTQGFEPPSGDPVGATAPPGPPPAPPRQPPPPPVARQLVRDPYTKLGGVASGLAHHYGLDVSLVRIAFVIFTLATGFGLPIYLLSWLIIPRAEYWPPVGARKPIRSLSAREIGLGLLLMGVLIALFFNGGAFSQILVPLVLVGGGVWLLIQPSAEGAVPNGSVPASGRPGSWFDGSAASAQSAVPPIPVPVPFDSLDDPFADPADPFASDGPPPVADGGLPRGTPVPPKRRRWPFVLIGFGFLIVAVPVGLVAALLLGGIDINSDFSVRYEPTTIETIPEDISHDQGEVVVDLTNLDSSMFGDETVPMQIELGFGDVRVIVPEDLAVDVEATAGFGDVDVFESSDDGIGPELRTGDDDPAVSLDIDVGFGQVSVVRE